MHRSYLLPAHEEHTFYKNQVRLKSRVLCSYTKVNRNYLQLNYRMLLIVGEYNLNGRAFAKGTLYTNGALQFINSLLHNIHAQA